MWFVFLSSSLGQHACNISVPHGFRSPLKVLYFRMHWRVDQAPATRASLSKLRYTPSHRRQLLDCSRKVEPAPATRFSPEWQSLDICVVESEGWTVELSLTVSLETVCSIRGVKQCDGTPVCKCEKIRVQWRTVEYWWNGQAYMKFFND
jgi:hypothetical protein